MLLSRISWLFKNSIKKNQNLSSFITTDIAQRNCSWEFTEMNIEELLPIAWKNLSNINFLRRFTWILNNEEISEYEYCKYLNIFLKLFLDKFLDKKITKLSAVPDSIDDISNAESLTLLDIKVSVWNKKFIFSYFYFEFLK